MLWFWLAISAAILWGFGYTINQITLKYYTPVELLFFESLISTLIISVYFFLSDSLISFSAKLTNPKLLLLIIASSIVYVCASMLILQSLVASNASLAAIIESCYPLFTFIFAYVILGEVQLNLISIGGILLILTGIVIVKNYS